MKDVVRSKVAVTPMETFEDGRQRKVLVSVMLTDEDGQTCSLCASLSLQEAQTLLVDLDEAIYRELY